METQFKELRKMLVSIYECVSAWDNDDGRMAEANEKTPEDILAEIIEKAKQEERDRIAKRAEEIIQENRFAGAPYAVNELIKFTNLI